MPDKDNDRYVIVPVLDASGNYTMLNNSTSRRFSEVRLNSDGTKYLFEMLLPQSQVFSPYQWYNRSEIISELEKPEWN